VNRTTWCVPASLLPDSRARIVNARLKQRPLSYRVGVHVLPNHFNRHGAHMTRTVFVQQPQRFGKDLGVPPAAIAPLAPVTRQRVQGRLAYPRVGIP
jgi:hypothetical protein